MLFPEGDDVMERMKSEKQIIKVVWKYYSWINLV